MRTALHVAPRSAAAVALGLAVAAVGIRLHPDTASDRVDTAASWLHAPLILAVVVAVAATIELHPTFGRDRADAPWLERLSIGPLGGCGIASISAAAVLALVAAVGAVVFEVGLRRGPSRPVDARVPFEIDGVLRLTPEAPRAELRAAWPALADRLELRPLSPFGGEALARVAFTVAANGAPIGGTRQAPPGGGLVRIELDGPARIERLAIALAPGERRTLLLPDGAVSAVARTGLPPASNAAIAGAASGVTVLVALAFASLGRRRLSPAVLQVAALGIVLAASTAAVLPASAAVDAVARSELAWNPTTVRSAAIATVASILAMAAAAVSVRLRGR